MRQQITIIINLCQFIMYLPLNIHMYGKQSVEVREKSFFSLLKTLYQMT